MNRAGDIVLFDPIHPYAIGFLEAARRRGLGTVCLWTSSRNRAGAWRYPPLGSESVSAHYQVDLDGVGLQRVAELLGRKHEVAAVIPHVEPMVAPSVTLAHLLGLSWAQPEVMPLFRNKYALKQALASAPEGPRINRIALVANVHDVRAAMESLDLDRIVLKPNEGYGNVSIGFFDRQSTDAAIAAHLAQHAGPMLLEELLTGTEYFVNGQVNAAGRVDVTRVGTYVRTTLNGRPNVELGDHTVRTSDPEFEMISAYATRVIETSGVRRTPFHLECMLDDRGPCLIEVAARLAGGEPTLDSGLHGVDIVEAALVQYLGDGNADRLPSNWTRYDEHITGPLLGVCEQAGRIARIRGLETAEAVPGFFAWSKRPAVGDKVVPTVDLFGSVWRIILVAPDPATWEERGEVMRSMIELDVVGRGDRRPMLLIRALAPAVARLVRRGWAYVTIR